MRRRNGHRTKVRHQSRELRLLRQRRVERAIREQHRREERTMASEDTIKRYYLARLAEYRRAGYSDSAAASAAAADTRAKYGRVPGN